MDLNAFDTRKGGSVPREMVLRNPADQDDILTGADGKPCIVLVLGAESPEYEAAVRAMEREATKDEKIQAFEGLLMQTKPLIVGFKNIHNGDKPATVADVEWFLRLQRLTGQPGQKSFMEQVQEFALNRRNFLGNVSAA